MKITEDDLNDLFTAKEDDESLEKSRDDFYKKLDSKAVNVKVGHKKIGESINDELAIRRVRKTIQAIPQKKRKKSEGPSELTLKALFFSGIIGFLLFIALNFSSYFQQFQWAYYNDYLGRRMPSATDDTKKSPTAAPSTTPTPVSQPLTNVVAPDGLPDLSKPESNELSIEKISITAPVIWNIEENDIIENLINGVVHYKGTSLPGEGGNVFITGHSSNYFWVKSDYNNIFALLDKLVVGDKIKVRKGKINYYYKVVETKVIKPSEVGVLQDTNKELLSLMTCYPVGTSLNRLIVQAELDHTSY